MGICNLISVLHPPRLQELALGPRNAFTKYVMATCDHPTDLLQRIAYTSRHSSGTRGDSRLAAFPVEVERELSVPFANQRYDVENIFYVIESRPRNPWAASGSVAFISVLLLALIVIPLFHTEALPKRETLTMLYLQPPPASGSKASSFQAPAPTSPSTYRPGSRSLSAPVQKIQEAPAVPVDATAGVVGGVPGGVLGGVPGEVLNQLANTASSAPVLPKPAQQAPVKRVRVASRVVEANLIHDVPPQYPAEAGRARIEGTVVLMAVIGRDGSVEDVRVESGLPILAQAAINAVRQWRYKPYLIDGEPVEVDSRITINFNLSTS
jgi:protein TonB